MEQSWQNVTEKESAGKAPDSAKDGVVEVLSIQDFFDGISDQIKEHKEFMCYDTNISIDEIFEKYYTNYNEEEPLLSGMYLANFITSWEMTWWKSSTPHFSDKYSRRYEIKINYNCSETELAEHFKSMELKAAELKKPTEYESVKAVHDYICKNVKYDKSLKNHTDLEGFRDGTMVCSGYSMAMFSLLENMGISSRIVTGMANSSDGTENHAWNVVRVDGNWYNIDATWDDVDNKLTPVYYDYFLKSDNDFSNHIRSDVYDKYTRSMAVNSYKQPFSTWTLFFGGNLSNYIMLIVFFYVIIVYVKKLISNKMSGGDYNE